MIVISVVIYCNLHVNILKISFNLMSNIYTILPAGVVLSSRTKVTRKQSILRIWPSSAAVRESRISTLKQRLDVETNVRISTLKHTSEFQRCNNSSSFTFKQSPSSTLKQHRTFWIQTNVRVSTSVQLQLKLVLIVTGTVTDVPQTFPHP